MSFLLKFMAPLLVSVGLSSSPAEDDYLYAPQVAPSVVFTLKNSIETAKTQVLLADVADCKGSRRICDESQAVIVQASPLAGKKASLSALQLDELIRREWPTLDFQVSGAKTVKIERASRFPDAAEVKSSLLMAVRQTLPEDLGLKVDIERINIAPSVKQGLDTGHYEFPLLRDALEVDYNFAMQNLRGQKSLQVQYITETNEVDQFNINVTFTMSKLIVVTTDQFSANHVIEAGDLERAYLPFTQNSTSYIEDEEDLIGKNIKVAVRRGQGLTANMVVSPHLVKRGQLISLTSEKEGVVVQSKAKALDNGIFGQIIEARKQGSKANIRVKVTGTQTGEVLF